jgi:MerR family copper efflux transcriptional regulator
MSTLAPRQTTTLETTMAHAMNIGEAAQAAGVTAKMIRHYESLGLIPEAARTDAGYRQYTARDVATLRFIRQSRTMGFSMKQIEQLLGLWADTGRESRDVRALAREHLADLERKIDEMARMKALLQPLAEGCQGDGRADCPILKSLAGDAAPPPSLAKAPRRIVEKHDARPRSAPKSELPDHGGLVAWMQGLHRAQPAQHA